MTAELTTTRRQLPDYLRPFKAKTSEYDVAGGAPIGRLSLEGKVFTALYRDQEQILKTAKGHAIPMFDVVIVGANPATTKTYYASTYTKAAKSARPDCASADGITPDVGVPHKQAPKCSGCDHNKWGTALGGTGGKRCQDNKRMAVVPEANLDNLEWGGPMLLRMPPASFKNFVPYKLSLERDGIDPHMVVTRLSFVAETAHPELDFEFQRFLEPGEAQRIAEWREADEAGHIQNEHLLRVLRASQVDLAEVAHEEEEEVKPEPAAAVAPTDRVAAAKIVARTGKPNGEAVTKPVAVFRKPEPPAPAPVPAPVAKSPTPEEAKKARLAALLAEAEALDAELNPEEGVAAETVQAATDEPINDDELSSIDLLNELTQELGRIPD